MGLNLCESIIVLMLSVFETSTSVYVECTNGDIHLILKDLEIRACATSGENFDEATAIKKIMKE